MSLNQQPFFHPSVPGSHYIVNSCKKTQKSVQVHLLQIYFVTKIRRTALLSVKNVGFMKLRRTKVNVEILSEELGGLV